MLLYFVTENITQVHIIETLIQKYKNTIHKVNSIGNSKGSKNKYSFDLQIVTLEINFIKNGTYYP